MILAIDPGNVHSAYCLYDEDKKLPIKYEKLENYEFLDTLSGLREQTDILALEGIASYGMSVGQTVFDTCLWSGRFWQFWESSGGKTSFVYRKDVKMHLCGSMRAKDSNIRQSLMDRYGSTREAAIGKKASPGPLYKMAGDCWAAFGVAITFAEADRSRMS